MYPELKIKVGKKRSANWCWYKEVWRENLVGLGISSQVKKKVISSTIWYETQNKYKETKHMLNIIEEECEDSRFLNTKQFLKSILIILKIYLALTSAMINFSACHMD